MLSWLASWMPRSRAVRHLIVLLAIALAVALGLVLHIGERNSRQEEHTTGSTAHDRVHVDARVQDKETTARELVLRVQVELKGKLTSDGDALVPSKDLRLEAPTSVGDDLSYRAGKRMAAQDIKVDLDPPATSGSPLGGASASDYPFDRYNTMIGFDAWLDGKPVPVSLTLRNLESRFKAAIVESPPQQGVASFDLTFTRSRGTLILAVIMMFIMWGITLAVLNATWLVIGQRSGMNWPALSWMAFTMFALVGFRNAAPGQPPFDSLLDYAAFLWAETIIALCLMAVVFFGIRAERNNPPPDDNADPTSSPPEPQPVRPDQRSFRAGEADAPRS